MSRKTFLTLVAFITLTIGSFALFAPAVLLEGKGVIPSEAANVWAREVGIALVSIGVATALLRAHPDSPTLRAFLVGNAVLQIGIFPIEISAYGSGIITKVSGVAPNSILHVLLAGGFIYFAVRIKTPESAARQET